MNDHRFIELLEPRQVLSSATASVVNVGETAGSTPSAATLAVTQRQMYFNAVHGTSNTQVLRITNNGDRRLTFAPGSIGFRGEGRRAFGLVNFPAEGVSLAPGRRFNLEIRFTAPAQGQTIQLARLLINSNDPRRPTTSIPLRGLPTAGTKDNLEPSLQKVLNLFNLPINVGDSTPEEYQLGTPTADSDEVRVQSLVRASNSAPVSIRPLAMFGVSTGPAVRLGTYKPGSPDDGQELWYVPQDTAQSVNPTVFGQTLINPGDKPFALFTQWPGFFETNGTERRVYSEDTLNNTWESNASKLRKMRFYPFVDSNGTAVANSYVVAVEEFTQNYDYQDLLFVITNVRPADVKPTIAVTTKDNQPSYGRLVFNKVQIPDANLPNTTKLNNTVQVRNTGDAPLTVSFDVTGNFAITSNGGSNITLAPGATRNVVVQFTATGGNVHMGTLNITSNDPDKPIVAIDLAGYWQQYSEQGPDKVQVEPTSQRIVNDIFGYKTVITRPGETLNNKGAITRVGDEILSPYWLAADDDGFVRVTQLASFHNQTYVTSSGTNAPAQTFISWFKQGSDPKLGQVITKHAAGDGQTLLPREDRALTNITSGAFRPSATPFGFVVERNETSDPTLNNNPAPGFGHFVRFWPAYDNEGKTIPNSYIMMHDYNREFTNYDFNDNIFLIENIKPANALKTPLTVFAEDTSRGARISFTSPATGPKILGFNIYRSATARGVYELLNDEGRLARRPVTTFIDTGVKSADLFYYRITSVGRNGIESAPVTVRI